MKFRLKSTDQIFSFLDKGSNLTGELEFAGTLRIDGNFHGSISTGDILIIGEHAHVHADIKAAEVEIYGQINGSIEATRRIQIFPNGRVRGDIQTPVLIMSAGALLDGRIRMAGDRPEDTIVAARGSTQVPNIRQERF